MTFWEIVVEVSTALQRGLYTCNVAEKFKMQISQSWNFVIGMFDNLDKIFLISSYWRKLTKFYEI